MSSKLVSLSGKQIEVKIMGQNYTMACTDDDEPGLLAAVRKVDATMCGIRDSGKIKARDRIAVLTGIHLAHELIQREAAQQQQSRANPQNERLADLLARLDRALLNDESPPAA